MSIAQSIVLPEIIAQAIAEKPELAAAFWARASEQHYAAVVEQNRDHLLVFVKEQVDFRAMAEACRGYQVYAGAAGQPATYSLGTLCRAQRVPDYCRGYALQRHPKGSRPRRGLGSRQRRFSTQGVSGTLWVGL